MKKLLLATFGACLVLAPLASLALAEDALDLPLMAEEIRTGKVDVGTEYSLEHKRGRLHVIHGFTLGLDCVDCHYGEKYQADFLLLRKGEPAVKGSKGYVDRTVCIACHREGTFATPFYGERPGKM